ncbi:hypothetical protein BCV69DRAFT_295787 [Microstroma glucosiphilum]|uniref:Uncharacterized protein n=1 Tax=Pseudomicrostroma glucosiphilum TaxID=1684307 RepID=A0A316TZB8_9BASI|nr:hypothetical protein BCV69DRAFT_295787 [Pseudomicrostroma glucosiphilum]PWN17653.1 hypothetical protein BCV69DRAFT_295787 [Pseudomicrostroma glucosiphilum]
MASSGNEATAAGPTTQHPRRHAASASKATTVLKRAVHNLTGQRTRAVTSLPINPSFGVADSQPPPTPPKARHPWDIPEPDSSTTSTTSPPIYQWPTKFSFSSPKERLTQEGPDGAAISKLCEEIRRRRKRTPLEPDEEVHAPSQMLKTEPTPPEHESCGMQNQMMEDEEMIFRAYRSCFVLPLVW